MDTTERKDAGTSTLDLALRVIEFLAVQSRSLTLGDIANEFSASKSTVYRHLVTLQRHGFVRQDAATGRYEAGVKLVVLGEATRTRFDIVSAARPFLVDLRDKTGQAVTLCTMVDDEIIVLELIQGRSIIEFGTRPGTRLALHASAHGKVWLAFGPQRLLDQTLEGPLEAWAAQTLTDPAALRADIDQARAQGWATAPNQVITGVNTVAAPVFDFRGQLTASVAIVGSTQFIEPAPSSAQIEDVTAAAGRISHDLGWRA